MNMVLQRGKMIMIYICLNLTKRKLEACTCKVITIAEMTGSLKPDAKDCICGQF
jgi:hypothetical protein